ncbi:MazG-like family protein [Bacillus velezensis]|uniref:MazG-like family protein n=1 Tax=Bacillus TaxID=1386 RepID=UPI001E30605B|nr:MULTISPECIES: MazG-like family protein [Bacillus amyloliquefaciens group]UHH01356.1 MazG-like family protein [Bacillus amyloliquefaciens]ULR21103.1 MazG-like family protein [Bacillus velezensis]UVW07846.1 MazG-like family protein [Bacillus velezensis]WHL75153.1 MazG-like family protein [Bacillus velezensis]WNP87113.1 MazG-like family protein [Bacillus velezensis]
MSVRKDLENLSQKVPNTVSRPTKLMLLVNDEVLIERTKQNEKWGIQRHSYGDWLMILGEEFGEVCEAMQRNKAWGKKTDAVDLHKELIQLAAVASAIAEHVIDERELTT